MTMKDIQSVLSKADYRGDGFFAHNGRELHAMWSGNRWVFVGYHEKESDAVGSFATLQAAALFLGL